MVTAEATVSKCEWCEEPLSVEEMELPNRADESICDDCNHEHYEYTCHWCEESEDIEHQLAIGSLFVVYEPTSARALWDPAMWYNTTTREMQPGLYRITEWPVYWGEVLDMGLYANAFEWLAPLPREMKGGGYAGYPCGPLCRECQVKLEDDARKEL